MEENAAAIIFNGNTLKGIAFLYTLSYSPKQIAELLLRHDGFRKREIGRFLSYSLAEPHITEKIVLVQFEYLSQLQLGNKDVFEAFQIFQKRIKMPGGSEEKFKIFDCFAKFFTSIYSSDECIKDIKKYYHVIPFACWYFNEKLNIQKEKDKKIIWSKFNNYLKSVIGYLSLKTEVLEKFNCYFEEIFRRVIEEH